MPQQKRVTMPDGTVHVFPAEATEAQIAQVLSGAKPAQTPMQPVASDRPREPTLQERKVFAESGRWPTQVKPPEMMHSEDLFPILGGTAGGAIGGVPGAGLGAMAGEGMRQVASQVRGRQPIMTPEQTASGLISQGTINAASEGVGAAIPAGIKHFSTVLMRSALKPSIRDTARSLGRGVPAEDLPVIQTMFREGVNVSPSGIEKLNRVIGSSNDEIARAIETIPGTVNPQAVAARTRELSRQLGNQVDPAADVSAVQGVTDRFLTQEGTTRAGQVGTRQVETGVLDMHGRMGTRAEPVMGRAPRELTLPEAQQMKTGTYRALKDKAYGEMKGPEIEANKALARGLKEEIETAAGRYGVDLKAVNAREGAAITAKEAIAKRVAAAGNRDPVALAWLANNPTSGLLFILERSPTVKSLLARGLYQSAEKVSGVPQHVLRVLATAMTPVSSHQQQEQDR